MCPRLVRWRQKTAREKVRRFADQEYWGRPVPGFGDREARMLLVGLAPASHGANRTGRMFTGDESGKWLFRALHRAGFATAPVSVGRADGQALTDCYITAAVRCAPPLNRPLLEEITHCRLWLVEELRLLSNIRVVVGLGRVGFYAGLDGYRALGRIAFRRRPGFAHAGVTQLGDLTFLASYHPSQQNTFTGRLTEEMLDRVFSTARKFLERPTG